jgi:hypothetical protein
MEHRWSPRRYLEGEVTMHYSPVGTFPAVLRDIGVGGMFIETDGMALPVNAAVVVSLVLRDQGEISPTGGTPGWCAPRDEGCGLMYVDTSEEILQPLRRRLPAPHRVAGAVAPARAAP